MLTLLFVAVVILRIQAEWAIYVSSWATRTLAYQEAPDNLVAFQWVVISTLGGVVVALAAYIRSNQAEMRQMAKDHKTEILMLAEKSLANSYEMKEIVKDNTEAIGILGEKLERNRARNTRTGKSNG